MNKFSNNNYNQNLLEFARELRSEKATKAERKLWKSVLCSRQSETRFLRQRPIDNFIVDFFAPEIALIIEVDGSSHLRKAEYDYYRQEKLKRLGYNVIRFKEGLVLNQLDEVKQSIDHAIYCLKTGHLP